MCVCVCVCVRRYGGISEGSVCMCEKLVKGVLCVCVCVRRYGGISEGSVCVCVCEEIWGN